MVSSSFAALSKHGNVIQREFFSKGEIQSSQLVGESG